MIITENNIDRNFNTIGVSNFWNYNDEKELRMHKIHAYPAKFPSLVISKSLQYARENNIRVNDVSDIFCGCGTTALEAKRNHLNFVGWDINPVATLIASVKSKQYNRKTLLKYYKVVLESIDDSGFDLTSEIALNERIRYWFHDGQIISLGGLLWSISNYVPKGKYRDFFYVAFSNILKKTSKWLMKSIKPQVDPDKTVYDVLDSFAFQFEMMLKANDEVVSDYTPKSKTSIKTKNFLDQRVNEGTTDLVITSPPYVTSYEYADLHQLSTLWLGYTDDYRNFRRGTIGSLYHEEISQKDVEKLPEVGRKIYSAMYKSDKRKAKSVAKYFVDMEKVVAKVGRMVRQNGAAVFVIGNTKYKDVEIDNAKFLSSCLLRHGFNEIEVSKRKISGKILSPYRDKNGRFSSNVKDKKVYSYEFVLIGKKNA